MTKWKELGEKIQGDLAEIGISVTIQEMAWTPFYEIFRAGQQDLVIGYFGPGYLDPDNYMWMVRSDMAGAGRCAYVNPELDALAKQAQVTIDSEKRAELYRQIQEIIMEDGPWAYLYQFKIPQVSRKSVTGFGYTPLTWTDLAPIDIE